MKGKLSLSCIWKSLERINKKLKFLVNITAILFWSELVVIGTLSYLYLPVLHAWTLVFCYKIRSLSFRMENYNKNAITRHLHVWCIVRCIVSPLLREKSMIKKRPINIVLYVLLNFYLYVIKIVILKSRGQQIIYK